MGRTGTTENLTLEEIAEIVRSHYGHASVSAIEVETEEVAYDPDYPELTATAVESITFRFWENEKGWGC